MITKILKSSASSAGSLDYNEEKCIEGVAEVIAVRNIESDSFYALRSALMKREVHPAISAKAKYLGFHMTVNPGPGDNMDDANAINYTDYMMKGLKYGKQPYVIFKHFDIERVHYHVVSVRVDAQGKIIPDSFSWLKTMELQEAASKEFGFTVGLENDNSKDKLLQPRKLKKGMKNLLSQIKVNVITAVRFIHSNERQFQAILRSFGITLRRGKKNGHDYVSFMGLAEDGSHICRPISVRKVLGRDFDASKFDEYYERHRPIVDTHIILNKGHDTIIKTGIAFKKSHSLEEFRHNLHRVKVDMFFVDKNGRVSDDITGATEALFVNMDDKVCMSADKCGISISRIMALPRKDIKENRRKKKKQEEPSIPIVQRKP